MTDISVPPLDPRPLAQVLFDWTMPEECVDGVRDNLMLLAEHAARVGEGDAA